MSQRPRFGEAPSKVGGTCLEDELASPVKQRPSRRATLIAAAVALLTLAGAGISWVLFSGGDRAELRALLEDAGFVELRPPNRLIEPGTWVEVQTRNPLRLRIVCSAESALRLTPEQLAESTSADTSITRALSGDFQMALAALGIGEGSSTSNVIRSADLRLSNVRLIELPDDQILRNLPNRDRTCAEAIRLRYESNPESLTMIDAVLIADAEYRFTFAGQASAGAKTSAVRDIARRADLSVGLERNDSSTLIGRNLVWGVQDDQLMAYQGIGLPNVGTSSERSRSILLDSGPIAEIDRTQQARRDFNDMAVRIRHDVPAMKQPTPMSCWAAVYAMMESWKGNQPITIERAIARLGEPYETYFTEDRGLPGGQELAFVEAAGLHALPPANYPLSTFRRLLREKGPIWIITGDGITSHARLLVGIYGRDEEEKRSSYELTIMEFIDPAQGSYVYEPALDFFEEFEREAAFIVNSNQDWVDLRWQILSY